MEIGYPLSDFSLAVWLSVYDCVHFCTSYCICLCEEGIEKSMLPEWNYLNDFSVCMDCRVDTNREKRVLSFLVLIWSLSI